MSEVRELAAGLGLTEGPLWTTDGRLLVTSIPLGVVCEIDVHRGGVVGRIDTGGGPNGLCQARDGRIWIAQNGGALTASRSNRPAAPGLQTLDPTDGAVTDVLTRGLSAPNDLVEGPDGRIWFTDPGPPPAAGADGRVHAYDPATGALSTEAQNVDYPNGLVFTDGGRTLLVGESGTGHVLRFGVGDGHLEPRGRFTTLPEGVPDGLVLLADGSLLAAAPYADLIAVFDPDGAPRTPIRPAPFPTNLCLAGDAQEWLVVTTGDDGRVLALDPSIS